MRSYVVIGTLIVLYAHEHYAEQKVMRVTARSPERAIYTAQELLRAQYPDGEVYWAHGVTAREVSTAEALRAMGYREMI